MINASYGGQTYADVDTLVASDGTNTATVTLTESGVVPTPTGTKTITENGTGIDVTNYAAVDVNVGGGGGSVGGLSEYNTQTAVLSLENVGGNVQGVKFAHGLSKAPTIIKMTLNYSGDPTDNKGIIFAVIGIVTPSGSNHCFALATNSSTGVLTAVYDYLAENPIASNAKFVVDSTYVSLSRATAAVTFDTVNSYTIECWA